MEKRDALSVLHRRDPALVITTEGRVAASNDGADRLFRSPGLVGRYFHHAVYEAREMFPYPNLEFGGLILDVAQDITKRHPNTRAGLHDIVLAMHQACPELIKKGQRQEVQLPRDRWERVAVFISREGLVEGGVLYSGVFDNGIREGHLFKFDLGVGRKSRVRGLVDRKLDLSVTGEKMPEGGYGNHETPGMF